MTAYYVQPEPSASGGETYWLEGYAEGDAKFGGAVLAATASMLNAPTRVQSTGYLSNGSATSKFGGNRIRFSRIATQATSSSLFGGNRVALGALSSGPSGQAILGGMAIKTSGAKSAALSTTLISGRLKWELDAVDQEAWVDQSVDDEIWIEQSVGAETWTPIA